MFKRLSLLVVAALILSYAFIAAPRPTLAGCVEGSVKITSVVAYRNAVVVTYTNPGLSSITFTASTSADGIIATKTVNPAVTGTGLTVTINLNSEKVSEGEEVGIEVAPCSFSEGVFETAHGFYNSGEEGSTSAVPPPACGDGRINFNDCGLIAIYPVEDEGSYGITVWIVDDESIGHFGFFVSAEDLDSLPEHPEKAIKIASSEDGFATLYKLPSGEYQINAGPDAEGKIFVYRFDGLPPSGYPTVSTIEG